MKPKVLIQSTLSYDRFKYFQEVLFQFPETSNRCTITITVAVKLEAKRDHRLETLMVFDETQRTPLYMLGQLAIDSK